MTDSAKTPYSSKCQILADLWMEYRDDEEFVDFIEYSDLALPLAYAFSQGIAESTMIAEGFINESWDLFLGGLGIEEDTGYDSLEDVLGIE
jgi:hypothetical protein